MSSTTTTDSQGAGYTSPALSSLLKQTGEGGAQPLHLRGLFDALTRPGSPFMKDFWQMKPYVSDPQDGISTLVNAWTMDKMAEAVDSEFLTAGRGTFQEGKTGWQMAMVGKPRGSSFEDAKLLSDEVHQAMKKKSGTVVFNSAGATIPAIAGVCMDATEAFGFPTCVNLYLTAAGQQTSAPPHTDYQDVFVLQTQGHKHWRVYAPPPPGRKPQVSPFTRGKDKDILKLEELGPPLIDTVLHPGQILYMPSGFPHTTDTVTGIDSEEPSVHITLGVDTHIWGLTHARMRDYVMQRMAQGSPPPPPPASTMENVDLFMSFHRALPLGCNVPAGVPMPAKWSEARVVHANQVVKDFLATVRAAEPESDVWKGEDAEVTERLGLLLVAEKLVDHHHRLVNQFREMYLDVKYKLSESVNDLSLFRSRPYLERIDMQMQGVVDWVSPPKAGNQGEVSTGSKKGFGAGGGGKKPVSTKGFGGKKKA